MGATELLVLVGVIAVLVIAVLLVIFFLSRRRRAQRREEQRERTREEFGSEYERTARETGSEEAEREPRGSSGRGAGRVEPLSEEDRSRYEEQWAEVERIFVENPERSIELADRTVSDVLKERNFVSDPAQSDGETERALAAMHPDVADDYREARHIRRSTGSWRRTKSRSTPGAGRRQRRSTRLLPLRRA